ncbi:MAG: CBS domain-containing protein [Rhizobiales bacterium]|nr:CBS domain-containing protein [Hyphomicrobiales bacterium]
MSLPATPLLSLDAAVLDTETTSLDTKRARVVQLGAVLIRNGKIDRVEGFQSLVNPGEAIPPASTAIHGITDEMVKDAPRFAAAMPDLAAYLGQRLVIGFAVDFDVAVLKREHALANRPWRDFRYLDLRDLSMLLAPPLPEFSLDTVAAWLGASGGRRHSALGDAQLTADAFLRLVPLLRERGIRTLGEAERAVRQMQPGRIAAASRDGAIAALSRVDTYPYQHRVRDVMKAPPVAIDPGVSIREALRLLVSRRISSVFIRPEGASGCWAIATERDILRALDTDSESALKRPIASIASAPLVTVADSDFIYRAIGRMSRKGFRHLGVVDQDGQLCGAVTSRDLLKQRASDAIALTDALRETCGIQELAAVWSQLAQAARSLLASEADPRDVAAIIAGEVCALTARCARMAEQELVDAGRPQPQCRYAGIVLGSGGRGESMLALDQDNAIIHDAPEEDREARDWLEAMAKSMNHLLNAVGVPLCKGGVMAGNSAWRLSDAEWRARIGNWLSKSSPVDILNADIFFDFRPVHGDSELAEKLRQDAITAASGTPVFLRMMAHQAGDIESHVGWFGRLRTDEDGRIDLKKGGIMPIFAAARVAALARRIAVRSTPERLAALRGQEGIAGSSIDGLTEAHKLLMGFILGQQIRDIDRGISAGNRVAPKELSETEQDQLRWALQHVKLVADLLGGPTAG